MHMYVFSAHRKRVQRLYKTLKADTLSICWLVAPLANPDSDLSNTAATAFVYYKYIRLNEIHRTISF